MARQADTIYFGGGTPSLLRPETISAIIQTCDRLYPLTEAPEITLEINPGSFRPNALEYLRNRGVNRVSLGIQSLNDADLQLMGRGHSAAQAVRSFREIRVSGFDNISVDLIAGYPNQTRDSFRQSLESVLQLEADHLSVYLLELKSGTVLETMIRSGRLAAVDEDLAADMYDDLCELTHSAGFDHYEISNFAMPGRRSRHNLKYWQDDIYIGLGPGAHGMTGTCRYANEHDPERYEKALAAGRLPEEVLDALKADIRFRDALIMGLRLVTGVDLIHLGQRYQVDAHAFVKDTIGDLESSGLFVLEPGRLALTHRGRLLSNIVFSRWV